VDVIVGDIELDFAIVDDTILTLRYEMVTNGGRVGDSMK
jgi:hypothetical protein